MQPVICNDYLLIDDEDGLARLLNRLPPHSRVAIDTEADSLHHYRAKVCLIQLSFNGINVIVDPLARIDAAKLINLLADKELVIHGADYDLRMLRESYGFEPRSGIFDTMLAAQLIGMPQVGLASLVSHFFGRALSKRGQKSDWSRRPLSPAQLGYACADTLFLLRLADLLTEGLERLKRRAWHRESCAWMVASALRARSEPRDDAWRIKGAGELNPRALAVLHSIWQWRDRQARRADLPPFKIMNNEHLISIAQAAVEHPHDDPLQGLRHRPHQLEAIRRSVAEALALEPSQWPPARVARKRLGPAPKGELLRAACMHAAQACGLAPALIASKATLESIARARPLSIEEIMRAGPTMRWQAELIVPIVRELYGEHRGSDT